MFHNPNMGNFQVHVITGDGNCLFRAMSYYVFKKQADHAFVRHLIVQHVCSHWDRFKNFFCEGEISEQRQDSDKDRQNKDQIIDKDRQNKDEVSEQRQISDRDRQHRDKYQNKMKKLKTHGGEPEIVAFTEIFQCEVEVLFRESPERDPLSFGNSDKSCFLLYSGKIDSGHYDVLKPVPSNSVDFEKHKQSISVLRENAREMFGKDLEDFEKDKENYEKDRENFEKDPENFEKGMDIFERD